MTTLRLILAFAAILAAFAIVRTAERESWTTSRIAGSPEPPPPFRASIAFANLKFSQPTVLARRPGSSTLYVGEQSGRVYAFDNRPNAMAELVFDLKKDLATLKQLPGAESTHELYGIVFHPNRNDECYLCYTLRGRRGERTGLFDHEKNLPDGTRVSRFKIKDSRIDPASEEIIITWLQGGHNGGDLHFGPDGMLYISTGDATDPNPPDLFKTGQDITDLLSSILRIDVDHREAGRNYAIPKDNPFVGTMQYGKPARGEVWAYGFRNPWRMSFDRTNGNLFAGDVGWEQWEMIHKIERGGNSGWSIVEARQQVNSTWPVGPTPIKPAVIEMDHSLAASITGGYVYRGKKHANLVGKYIFGDWSTRRIWAATIEGDRLQKLDELTEPSVRVVAFGEDNAGELYFLDYDTGRVHQLEANDAAKYDPARFPRTLSQTGLFESVTEQKPARGVYPFRIIADQWQDGAIADRWIALPENSFVIDNDQRRPIPGDVDWHQYKYHFPRNAVLVKTLSLKTDMANKRVETQLLHFDGVDWHGYSYRWRADQTDADLVDADGAEQSYVVPDERVLGGKREVNWQFNSRTQCMQCHNFWAEHTLAFNSVQLNRDVTIDGKPRNQLVHFAELGLMKRADRQGRLKGPHDAATVATLPKLVDPEEQNDNIAGRARSYLHANCAHCHRFGGGGAVEFELTFDADLQRGKLFDAPTRGSFDIPDARVVAKGDPGRSALYYRMAKFGSGRMPHLGSEFVDEGGVVLIQNWILQMTNGKQPQDTGDFDQQWKSVAGGLELARSAACDCCVKEERERILSAAAKLPPGAVRDLFEGYLAKPGGERKLGRNPRAKTILSLTGDISKGRELFLNEKLKCVTCHKVGDKGQEIGPNLTTLSGPRTKAELLESMLDPDRRVEPAYQAYLLKTLDGRSLTGIVVKRTDAEIVLKSSEGKETSLKPSDVESQTPSRSSLMPTGLLTDLTPQQAADLLAYVVFLKDAPR